MRYAFIEKNIHDHPIEDLCEALAVKRSGYYSWRDRPVSARKREDVKLKNRVIELHKLARGRYGHRPIYHHLQDENICCGRDRTLRLMTELGLKGDQSTRYKPVATDSKHLFGYSPNLLKEFGKPAELNQVWVADTTYLLTVAGWNYLATVMDLCSRRIIGWSVSPRNDTELICEALNNAVASRGDLPSGIINHSDRGSTYASDRYQELLQEHLFESSMSAKGNCYDNAEMESFYGRYKNSSVRDTVFRDESCLRANVFEYIEIFYNRFRKHSSLGYKSPKQFEEKFAPRGGHPKRAKRQQLAFQIANP